MEKRYDKTRDLRSLEPFYGMNVLAMTVEDLHEKSDIAAELAYRDKRIAELEEAVDAISRLTGFSRENGP